MFPDLKKLMAWMVKLNGPIRFLLTRIFILYGSAFLLFSALTNEGKVRAKTLNQLKPESFDYLTGLGKSRDKAVNRKEFNRYIRYYEKVIEYLPESAVAHTMLGFCYFYSGNSGRAARHYEQAIALEPKYFWPYYNLGMMSFRDSRYAEASEWFKKGAATEAEDTLRVMVSSRSYWPVIDSAVGFDYNRLIDSLRGAYRDSYRMLMLCHYRLGDFEHAFSYGSAVISAKLDDDAFSYYYAGLALYHLEKYKGCKIFLTEAVKRDPQNARIYHDLGLCLQALGEQASANHAFEREAFFEKSPTAVEFEENFELRFY